MYTDVHVSLSGYIHAGFLTAKAARPDVYRAGSMIIRAFHSSQIAWSFRSSMEEVPNVHQEGIWLKSFQAGKGRAIGHSATDGAREDGETTEPGETSAVDDEFGTDERDESAEEDEIEDEEEEEEEDRNDAVQGSALSTAPKSAFALLALENEGSDESNGE